MFKDGINAQFNIIKVKIWNCMDTVLPPLEFHQLVADLIREPLPNRACWNACNYRIWLHIIHYYGMGCNDCSIANLDTRLDECTLTNPNIIANYDR